MRTLRKARAPEADETFEPQGEILKVDRDLGLVFGWLLVCKTRDDFDSEFAKFYDSQGDHATEEGSVDAACDYMLKSRAAKEMHEGTVCGRAVFCFPLTEEIAKRFDIQTKKTGILFASKPDDDAVLAKFESGEYTGFSIGGKYINRVPVEE